MCVTRVYLCVWQALPQRTQSWPGQGGKTFNRSDKQSQRIRRQRGAGPQPAQAWIRREHRGGGLFQHLADQRFSRRLFDVSPWKAGLCLRKQTCVSGKQGVGWGSQCLLPGSKFLLQASKSMPEEASFCFRHAIVCFRQADCCFRQTGACFWQAN